MRCNLCPRKCNVKRDQGEAGFCKSPWKIQAARASLHMWEEPVISGIFGSGTVFFSGCNLGCVFCQNEEIANASVAKEITTERLCEIFLNLQEKGAHNINLVTAAHYVPQLVPALRTAKENGLLIPVVYNSSGYESVKTLRLLDGLVDIYMPDFKYYAAEVAGRYSDAEDYFIVAKDALSEMYRQVGSPVFEEIDAKALRIYAEEKRIQTTDYYTVYDPDEETLLMKKGLLVRHLLMPGQKEDSKQVLKYLIDNYGENIYISIMNQYTPCNELRGFPELLRRVTEEEYEEVIDYAISCGIENGFIQEGDTAMESFIPAFDYEGL